MNTWKSTIASAAVATVLLFVLAGCTGAGRAQRSTISPEREDSPAAITLQETPRGGGDDHWNRKLADRYFLEGSVLQMQERYADAIVQYRRALRFMPEGYSVVHFAIARCYQLLGVSDTAMVYSREAVERDPANVDARSQLADLLMANGRINGALRQYDEILRIQPSNLEARFSLAHLLQWSDPAQAAQHYEYIRAHFDGNDEILLSLAEIYLNLGRMDEAIDAMRDLIAISPADADLYRIITDMYLRAGRYDDALRMLPEVERHLLPAEAYEEFLAEQLDSTAERMWREQEEGFGSYAAQIAARASARFPWNWRIGFNNGLINYHLGNDAAADSFLLRALDDSEASATAWVEAAILYINEGKSQRALGFMVPTAGRYDDDYRIPYLLGYAYLLMNQQDSAITYLRRSLDLEEENSEAWGHLAMIYSSRDMIATSDAAYERALEYDPYNANFLNNYAYSLAERGKRLEKALMMAEMALDAEPENESFLDTRGWIYYKMGEYDEALEDIRKAVDAGGAGADVLVHLGDVHQALGNRSDALDAYERALRLRPADERIREKIETVR